jgi:predicted TIM-barrel fold metal-dependent hydrolase
MGACDCHTHVVGDASLFPMVQERFYTPGPAPHEALAAHLRRNGLQRTVIVQPSFYGTDNRCMIESLRRLQGQARGVAVVDDGVDDDELERLHAQGVRGLRVNIASAGVDDMQALAEPLQRWAERLPARWHLQIYAAHGTIARLAPLLDDLPVPVVLDHFAMVPATTPDDDPDLRSILALVASGNAYVKLSAPYRVADAAAVASAARLTQAFLRAHPERVLWGSDWPHTNREPGKAALEVSRYRDVPPDALRESIDAWLPDAAIRQRVLVDNPACLYDFG